MTRLQIYAEDVDSLRASIKTLDLLIKRVGRYSGDSVWSDYSVYKAQIVRSQIKSVLKNIDFINADRRAVSHG